MRYPFIHAEKATYPIGMLCRVLQVWPSGYYAWRRRAARPRQGANRVLLQQIRILFAQFHQRYGSPRIYRELRAQGQCVGRHRVARLMRQAGLQAQRPKRYKTTTDSTHDRPIAPNRLGRDFASQAPNEKWVGDITYIPTDEGWLYLAVILNLFARRVVGWSMRPHMKDELTLEALDRAWAQRQPPPTLIHHSDQGSQYASDAYRARLRKHRLRPSMSRVGDCWDNAVAESFFASLKTELVHRQRFVTRAQARSALFEYIEGFYNTHRRHSTLDYLRPAEFERRYAA